MKLYENTLFRRLTVTLAIIFFSILIMIYWWQLLFNRTLNYFVISEKKEIEVRLYQGLNNHILINQLTQENKIHIVEKCVIDVCVKIPNASRYYEINPEYEHNILAEKARKLRMFQWESSFLISILLFTIGYMFWVILREKKNQIEKQEFLSMTTHELKHPVSVISLVLESLQRESLPRERIQEFIEKGLQEIKTLKKSLENILKLQELTFSKPDNTLPFKINEYLNNIFLNWQIHELNKNGRLFLVKDASNEFLVHTNQKDLQIILNNLIENALLYSSQEVYIITGKDTKGIYVEIKDKGLGFDDDDKNNFQKMFFRSRRHDIQNIRGSGLGHYIIKKLLDKHSLQLTLDSQGENKGSVFRLYLK